jgi:hypothetical protein
MWVYDKEAEEIAGHKKQCVGSHVKGIYDNKENVIFLNTLIREMKYPSLNEIDCLLHEFTHFFFHSHCIDILLDKFNLLIIDPCKYRRKEKKKCK